MTAYGALSPQLTRSWEEGGELQFYNATGAVLTGGLALVIDTSHQLDSAVAFGLNQLGIGAKLPTTGSPAAGSLGVLVTSVTAGQTGDIQIRGVAPAICAGSVGAKTLLSICTISGKEGWLQAAATGEEIIGQALVDGTDSAQFIVRLFGSVSIHP